MKINEIYHRSPYFPRFDNPERDAKTYMNIRAAGKSDRSVWVGIVRTLAAYGNSEEEISTAILMYNTCGFTDAIKTAAMVRLFLGSENNQNNQKPYGHKESIIKHTVASRKSVVFNDATAYLLYFCQYYGIDAESVPVDPREAAMHHIQRGRIPLPIVKDTKRPYLAHRPPKFRYSWKNGGIDYSKIIMTEKDLHSAWDWSGGLCLIVPTDWRDDCYLDIDLKSEKHQDGMEYIDPEWFRGFHYEKTRNGGYHLFGKGKPEKPPQGVGLQLVSTLIVTYPTEGYKI